MDRGVIQIESYNPRPSQRKFHASPCKYRLGLGGWGGGKSAAMVWEALVEGIVDSPGMLACFFRKTGPALRDTLLELFQQICPPEIIKSKRATEGREEYVLTNGTRYWFRPLHNWQRLGSTVFDWIGIDEADELDYADFRTLRGRLRGRVGPRRMVLVTNPPNVDHWLYQHFVKEPLQSSAVFHFPMIENVEALGQDYIDDQVANLSPSEKRKYVYGLWGFVQEGDPVYADFAEELHMSPKLRFYQDLPLYRGWDFGYRHPALSWGQKLRSGHINVLGELVRTNTKLEDFIRQARDYQAETFGDVPEDQLIDFCDIAGKQTREDGRNAIKTLHEHRIFPRRRRLDLKRTVEVLRAGLSRMAERRPILMFHSRCRFTHEAFAGGYVWNPKKDEPMKDEDNFYDDIADATRYWVAPNLMLLISRWGNTYKSTDRRSRPHGRLPNQGRQRVAV